MSVRWNFAGSRSKSLRRGMRVVVEHMGTLRDAWVVDPGARCTGVVWSNPPPPGEPWGDDFPRRGELRPNNENIYVHNPEEVARLELSAEIRTLLGEITDGLPWSPFGKSVYTVSDLMALRAAITQFRERK